MICDDRRLDETGKLEPAVAVRCTHHRNLDALIAQSGDTPGPFAFDHCSAFELKAELAKEIDCRSEVVYHDPHVVHSLERHIPISVISRGPYTRRTLGPVPAPSNRGVVPRTRTSGGIRIRSGATASPPIWRRMRRAAVRPMPSGEFQTEVSAGVWWMTASISS